MSRCQWMADDAKGIEDVSNPTDRKKDSAKRCQDRDFA
jgi:hypothetical protein